MDRRPRFSRSIRWIVLLAIVAGSVVSPLPTPAPAAAATVRWGYYITYDGTSLSSLRQHIGQLDIVSPYFYGLKADGTIRDFSSAEGLKVMGDAGVKIVPMIKNEARWADFTSTIGTAEKRDAIVQRLWNLVESHDYDGIHIDYEAVLPADAPLITDFMRRLSAKFRPNGKLVTQAVIARTSDSSTTWNGAYDYAALAQVNDYIAVMAYDFHSVGYGPGPIAPIEWVRRVASYSKTKIPAAKILLGMPLYGYDWNVTTGENAASLRFDQTTEMLARPGTTSGYDTAQATPWFRYQDEDGDQHEAWYENAASLRAKLAVMTDQNLGGFALWRLGHEDPAVWTEIARLATPATRIPPFANTSSRVYFPETGHSLALGFKSFWERNGGLPVFGYPLTEEYQETDPIEFRSLTVQYFERQRFEYHPEHSGTPYEVELGLLGVAEAKRLGILDDLPFQSLPDGTSSDANCDFFPETGHRLCFGFRSYWYAHGLEFGDAAMSFRESLALFGYPISEEFVDPATGLTVQYFERARFEYHPKNPEPHRVLLGLLGTETVRGKGWIQ